MNDPITRADNIECLLLSSIGKSRYNLFNDNGFYSIVGNTCYLLLFPGQLSAKPCQ